jgi:hypothetical protein
MQVLKNSKLMNAKGYVMKNHKTIRRVVNNTVLLIKCMKNKTQLMRGVHTSYNWSIKEEGDCTSSYCNTKSGARRIIKSLSTPYVSCLR